MTIEGYKKKKKIENFKGSAPIILFPSNFEPKQLNEDFSFRHF